MLQYITESLYNIFKTAGPVRNDDAGDDDGDDQDNDDDDDNNDEDNDND